VTTIEQLTVYTEQDAADIGALLFSLNDKFGKQPVAQSLLEEIITSPHHAQLVARQGGKIVGIATLSITIGTGAGRKAYLEDFVVDPNLQGHGIGSLIWKEIAAWCKKQHVTLHFTSNPLREAAHKFYLKHGATIRETSVFEFKGE
jgi:GNAT superfamily N-acetyltransferase